MKFTDYRIANEIKSNLGKLGFKRPTDIQFKAIPAVMRGEDVLAIAQTGTGKTAAFAIPIIDAIHFRKKKSNRADGIKALVMVPTRELAIQIGEAFHKLEQNTRVKSFSVFGGVEQDDQISKLQKGVDILIATPGRMFDLIHQKHIDLSRLSTLVLDEADHMLDLGFIKDIKDVIKFLPKQRQTLFFSATIDEKIKKLAYSLVRNPIRIEISPKNPVSKNVRHSVAFIEMDDKRFFLERMIKEHSDKKILVFVRTKVRAERVQKAMERVDVAVETIHGDKDQKDRLGVLNKFKSGELQVLIATDVSSRGIDIPNVNLVINYDMPTEAENYVHRVGRTGRGTSKGDAISFCSKEEKELLKEVEEYTGYSISESTIDRAEYKATIKISEDKTSDIQKLMKEIKEFEDFKPRKKKKK